MIDLDDAPRRFVDLLLPKLIFFEAVRYRFLHKNYFAAPRQHEART